MEQSHGRRRCLFAFDGGAVEFRLALLDSVIFRLLLLLRTPLRGGLLLELDTTRLRLQGKQ